MENIRRILANCYNVDVYMKRSSQDWKRWDRRHTLTWNKPASSSGSNPVLVRSWLHKISHALCSDATRRARLGVSPAAILAPTAQTFSSSARMASKRCRVLRLVIYVARRGSARSRRICRKDLAVADVTRGHCGSFVKDACVLSGRCS